VDVAHHRGRLVADRPAERAQPPGQVGVLVVQEEVVVEEARLTQRAGAEAHRRAAEGEHLLGALVLAEVGLLVGPVGAVAVGEHLAAGVVEHVHHPDVGGQVDLGVGHLLGRLDGGGTAVPADLDRLGGLGGQAQAEAELAG
jgi:hypothetical protein